MWQVPPQSAAAHLKYVQMLEELLQGSIKYITYKSFGNTSHLAHLGSYVLQFFLLSLLALLMKQLLFGFRLKYIFRLLLCCWPFEMHEVL